MAKSNMLETIKENPVAIQAFEYLWKLGLIYPGAVVEGHYVEAALGMPYEDSWTFLGKYLALQIKLKSEGFFVNQKKMRPPGFRIIKSEDMAEMGTKRLMEAVSYNFETAYVMAAHDTSKLNEDQQKKHKKVQQKAAQAAILQQKVLLDQSFF
jgi:hypothetical protein